MHGRQRFSEVGGAGQAFRCGGEEFAIVFRDSSAKESFDHLDALRQTIEKSTFQVRGADRRGGKSNWDEGRREIRASDELSSKRTLSKQERAVPIAGNPKVPGSDSRHRLTKERSAAIISR